MQNRGMLTKWNDDRGFGFIKHSESETIFIHISSVKMMPRRPKEGDYLFYDVVIDPSGKKTAACVTIEGVKKVPTSTSRPLKNKPSGFNASLIFSIVFLVVLFVYVKTHYFSSGEKNISEVVTVKEKVKFTCQGKTHCSQMTSCEEATFYLRNCPGQQTDGNGDGEPCESQWCN